MKKAIVRDEARADFQHIVVWVADQNKMAARNIAYLINQAIARIERFPNMHPAGQAPGTRECVVPRTPYIIVYEPGTDTTASIIQAIFHGAQDRDDRQDHP